MGSHASATLPRPRSRRPADAAAIRGILNALRRVVRHLRLSGRAAERMAGVSGAQLFVLQSLADGPAASIGELAERTSTDPSSVSVVVQRLVDKRLVARATSAEDGRRVSLALTAAGRRVLARCPEPTQSRLLEGLRRLGPAELSALATGTAALELAMGIESEPPRMFFEEAPDPPRLRRIAPLEGSSARGVTRGAPRSRKKR
jgi:DNA-binding MarR family transcriptional regulator